MTMENMFIQEVDVVTEDFVKAIQSLLAQLTSSPVSFEQHDLEQLVASPSSRLFFIYCEGQIAGMLTLGSYLTPTGPKTWVEDVVIDEHFRGRSLGKKLMEFAIAEAGKIRANQLMLTSKPARVAANALYQAVGFESKQTNVYRMVFDD